MVSDVTNGFWQTIRRSRYVPAARYAVAIASIGALAGCQDSGGLSSNNRAYQPIPADVVALMQEKDTDSHAPILIRAFKKEAELEVWKLDHHGSYVHLKTYPMCRWSGQLGPKTREGDRQVPEGFYTITPGQMNPNSAYYLSFNVGYPNAYDKAHSFTGGAIMVHGICSSAGCFSMTDEQIAEIYAITREAFGGGQRAIQMQSLPFRMTAANLAKHRFDPNIKFWKTLKEGSDQFEVSKQETRVSVCNKQYVFGETPASGASLDPAGACPPMQSDPELKARVAEKQHRDDAEVAEYVAKGVKPVKIVYADGGQHPTFTAQYRQASRPEALAQGPVEIPIDEKGRAIPVAVAAAPSIAPAVAAAPVATQVAKVIPGKSVPTVAAATSLVAKSGPAEKAPADTAAFAAPEPKASPSVAQSFFDRVLGKASAPAVDQGADDKPQASLDKSSGVPASYTALATSGR